jgi:hypothetical protein
MADREIPSPQDLWNFIGAQGAAGTDEIGEGKGFGEAVGGC